MRIAVIGTGKTGGAVFCLAQAKHEAVGFNSENKVTAETLKTFDAAIIFVPAEGFHDLLPVLQKAKTPAVIGTTGFPFAKLSAPEAPWIVASNFSRGMNLMFALSRILGEVPKIAPEATLHIHEVHHTQKKDSPSGTALHLQSLLPKNTEISAERIGDAKGLHRLELNLPGETLKIEHEALSREVFAAGALWAATDFLPKLKPGIHQFETLVADQLRKDLFHV